MEIIQAPHQVLAAIAKPVAKIDKKIARLIEEMKETLEAAKDPQGVGLAAPQVGKSLQLFLMKPTPSSKIKVILNPKIMQTQINTDDQRQSASKSAKIKSRKRKTLEGCLSLKNIWGEVIRKPMITVSYMDEYGKTHADTFKGFAATIVQHEIDHLYGILFTQHVLEQKGMLYKSKKDKNGKDVFEEIEV